MIKPITRNRWQRILIAGLTMLIQALAAVAVYYAGGEPPIKWSFPTAALCPQSDTYH